jgi:hypothetical protein
VAAVSTNLADLSNTAREMVVLSLKLGLYARHRSALVEFSSESWSAAIGSKTAEEIGSAIVEFLQDRVSTQTRAV